MSIGVLGLFVIVLSLGALVAVIAGAVLLGIKLSKGRRHDGDARPSRPV